MVVRHDVNVEAIGTMAILPPDLSPLQIGTQGDLQGLTFTILGRVRLAYDDGSWNEWFAVFSDGHYGWIAEAQGVFMVSFESTAPDSLSNSDDLTIGRLLNIENQTYSVTDKKKTVCLAAEGELPVTVPPGRQAVSVDLAGTNGEFASLEYSDGGARLFLGRYAQFEELKFSNLRPVPGWSEEVAEPTRHQTTAMNCPKCGAPVSLRAAGFTMSAACPSCGGLLDTSTPDLKLICEVEQRQTIKPKIPVGTRGTLFGVVYEVIGFQRVKDEMSGWFEYLLFNPWQGFVWLVSYAGHWTFVRRLFETPTVNESGIFSKVAQAYFKGESYRLFAVSGVETDYVVGEFYWKVSLGMQTNVSDFVKPPEILSREAYPNLTEVTWSQGEYVEPSIIREAFNLESELSQPVGTYLNQPNPHLAKAQQLRWIAPLVCLFLLVIQVVSASRAPHKKVLSAAYLYQVGNTNSTVVTEPFVVEGGRQALDLELEAPVDNNWLELGVDLVKQDSQQAVASFEEGVEFYHGYDDGYWSEGGRTRHRLVPGVDPGKYRLVLDASADPGIGELPYTVTVVRGVVVWSNFWIALGLLMIYPVYCWVRAYSFERARWLESDYSPYSSNTDDDD